MRVQDKIKIMCTFVDGKAIECLYEGNWYDAPRPIWDWAACDYRIKENVPDSIDWNHVAPNLRFLWRIEEQAFLLEVKPTMEEYGYINYHGSKLIDAKNFASYKRGTIDWRKSLVERPE